MILKYILFRYAPKVQLCQKNTSKWMLPYLAGSFWPRDRRCGSDTRIQYEHGSHNTSKAAGIYPLLAQVFFFLRKNKSKTFFLHTYVRKSCLEEESPPRRYRASARELSLPPHETARAVDEEINNTSRCRYR